MLNRISPEVILFLIAYAFKLDWKTLQREAARSDLSDSSLLELLSFVLVKWTEKIIREGLYKSFIDEIAPLKKIKGKVLFQEMLKQAGRRREEVVCQFDDLSYDTLENQIILATLQFSRQKLWPIEPWLSTRRKEQREQLNRELFRLEKMLSMYVSLKPLSNQLFHQLYFHRLNIRYHSILSLCQYIYYYLLMTEVEEGRGVKFTDFPEERMSEIFEEFLRNYLMEKLYKEGYRVKKQRASRWIELIEQEGYPYSLFPEIQPDIVIYDGERPILVIDAKYYKHPLGLAAGYYRIGKGEEEGERGGGGSGGGKLEIQSTISDSDIEIKKRYKAHSANLYQIISYTSYFNCHGLLVYALAEGSYFKSFGRISENYYQREGYTLGRKIGLYALDLGGRLEDFLERMKDFSDMVVAYALG